jgi:hypothetical protein
MEVTAMSMPSIVDLTRTQLGLDTTTALESQTALAAAVRRAVSLLAPSSRRTIRSTVTKALRPLVPDTEDLRDRIDDTIEDLLGYGDIVQAEATHGGPLDLFLAAPAFVENADGRLFVIGAKAGDPLGVPEGLRAFLVNTGHVRYVSIAACADAKAQLTEGGFLELSLQQWRGAPSLSSAGDHRQTYDTALSGRGRAGYLEGLTLIDPARSVTFYRGRWVAQRRQTGRFVARRPQKYGAERWCYIEIDDGTVTRLLDLPLGNSERGCDQAWRLQAAIDSVAGHPQRLRIRSSPKSGSVVEVMSPIPRWLQRRWDLVGVSTEPSHALIAYVMDDAVAEQEASYAETSMWLKAIPE